MSTLEIIQKIQAENIQQVMIAGSFYFNQEAIKDLKNLYASNLIWNCYKVRGILFIY